MKTDSTDRTDAAPKPSATDGAGSPDTPDREMDATNAALLAVITGGTVADVSAALAAERRAWLQYGADYALWTMKRLRGGKP